MTARTLTFPLLALAIVVGCARQQPVPIWQPERSVELARAAEADSSLLSEEWWLWESGLSHAFPQSPAFDPRLARDRFERLLQLFPQTRHGAMVSYLMPLLDEVRRREGEARRIRQEIARLEEEVASREARIQQLEERLESAELQEEQSRATITELRLEIQDRDRTIGALEEKLEGLMEIDLQQGS